MQDDLAISVQAVGKTYRIWQTPSARVTTPLLKTAAGIFPQAFALKVERFAADSFRDFAALNGVSFEVKKGESVGIIGRNGSGKSTLLQIIAGTLRPTDGSVQIHGRVAALLELGSGFNPEFTGRENVYLNGAVLGMSRREIDVSFDQIADFADIGGFIDQPVKTYSSGMMVRLAFAIQTVIEPEILIIDEALSVGDFFFQQKCFKRIAELRTRGTTLLFVSHDVGTVRDLCNRALYLKQGRQVDFGESQHVISLYLREENAAEASRPDHPPGTESEQTNITRSQEIYRGAIWVNDAEQPNAAKGIAHIISVRVLDAQRRPTNALKMGQRAVIQAYILIHQNESLHFAVEIKNRHGQLVSSLGTRPIGLPPLAAVRGQIMEFEAEVEVGLEAGEYSLQAVLGLPDSRANVGIRVHATPWLGPITINWNYEQDPAPFLGMFHLQAQIKFAVYSNYSAAIQ
jgi:lipopolysaccharide transport system ATP-binding protein